MTVFYAYDIPPERTKESFRYHISFIWAGSPVEEFWTDEPTERDRLVCAADDQEYSVLVELGRSRP